MQTVCIHGSQKKKSPFWRIGAHADQMTNPKRERSTFTVTDLVVISAQGRVELRLQDRGTASVPLAENHLPRHKCLPEEG